MLMLVARCAHPLTLPVDAGREFARLRRIANAPYTDTRLPAAKRVADLLNRMEVGPHLK